MEKKKFSKGIWINIMVNNNNLNRKWIISWVDLCVFMTIIIIIQKIVKIIVITNKILTKLSIITIITCIIVMAKM